MIKLMWTKSSLPLSKLIMWVFKEPCSHFAIAFDDHFVFHSDLLGSEATFYKWFLNSHTLVHSIILNPGIEIEDQVWDLIVEKFDRPKKYDFGAFIYFGLCGLAHRIFGRPMPKKNIWASSTAYLCEEIVEVLNPISEIKIPENIDLITPEQLWLAQQK